MLAMSLRGRPSAQICPHCDAPEPTDHRIVRKSGWVVIVVGRLYWVTFFAEASVVVEAPNGRSLELEGRQPVTAEQFGDDWPLRVDGGELRCYAGEVVTLSTPTDEYAVNGTAQALDFPRLDPIWTENTDSMVHGPRLNLRPLIDRGRALCADG